MATTEERLAELESKVAHLESDLKGHQHCYLDTKWYGKGSNEIKRTTDIPNWQPHAWLPIDGPPSLED